VWRLLGAVERKGDSLVCDAGCFGGLATTKNPSLQTIKEAMNGHLCRCGTYTAVIEAIQLAAKTMAKGA
jgi:aerobic-type carbon monoxide dehydrogenase small subunit (CoxS/CutS family)